MKFNCEIDSIKTLKSGMKVTLAIGNKETKDVMKNIYNFMDKPIEVDLLINKDEQINRMKQIQPGQRNKIFAIIKDIAEYTNDNKEYIRDETKSAFIRVSEYEDFSLSNCSKEIASDYIEYLIRIAFEMGVPFSENPADSLDDIENYLKICIEKRKCCICGRDGELHHVDAVGMGRNRKTIDDSMNLKMCLCRVHHTEYHKTGVLDFNDKYKVHGVIV